MLEYFIFDSDGILWTNESNFTINYYNYINNIENINYEEEEEEDYNDLNQKELIYSFDKQLENYEELFFFPFSLILRNQEYEYRERIHLSNFSVEEYLNFFLRDREQKLNQILSKTLLEKNFKGLHLNKLDNSFFISEEIRSKILKEAIDKILNLKKYSDLKRFIHLNKYIDSDDTKLYEMLISAEESEENYDFNFDEMKKKLISITNNLMKLEFFNLDNVKKSINSYLKTAFIKITFDTLYSTEFHKIINNLKSLIPYMSKNRWFKFYIFEISKYLKNSYCDDDFHFDTICFFSDILKTNSNEDKFYSKLKTTLEKTQIFLDIDPSFSADFFIESYLNFFEKKNIVLGNKIELSGNRNSKMIHKKSEFLNNIFNYYFNEENIIKKYNLNQRQINLLTSNEVLNDIENYENFLCYFYENQFSKEVFEDFKQKKLNYTKDNLYIIIAKIWIHYEELPSSNLIRIKKILLGIINIIRNSNNEKAYRSRVLKEDEYLNKFKEEFLKFDQLNIEKQNIIYERLLKLNEILILK